jgi:hypothetical protein
VLGILHADACIRAQIRAPSVEIPNHTTLGICQPAEALSSSATNPKRRKEQSWLSKFGQWFKWKFFSPVA